jgi:hypothetical protein
VRILDVDQELRLFGPVRPQFPGLIPPSLDQIARPYGEFSFSVFGTVRHQDLSRQILVPRPQYQLVGPGKNVNYE